jgi:PAT family beta-lactamase induction signal transducer AmpG
MMAATLLGFVGMSDPAGNLRYILTMYFLHNCFASLQDLCTDALAVDILPFHEQGRMNGMMWCSKLVGKGVGAYGLSVMLNRFGLEACVGVQIALLLGILLIPLFLLERPGEKRFPWSRGVEGATTEPSVRNPVLVMKEFLRGFSLTTTLVYVVFATTKLIGVGVNETATNTLFTQHLDPVWTDVEYSKVSGLYTIAPILVATLFGGFLSDRFGRRPILITGFGGYGLAAMLFASAPDLWSERWFGAMYLVAGETLYAIGSVGFLSMAMRISWTAAAATVFTTYMTLSNFSHVLGNWLAGPLRAFLAGEGADHLTPLDSYERVFWFVGVASLAPLLLLPWVRPQEVDRAKDGNERRAAEVASALEPIVR